MIPARIAWTATLLEVRPDMRLLEIGCGPGHAVALVAARLAGTGHLTAIDRSATMVARARARNAAAVASGRVVIAQRSLAQAAAHGGAFDELFAINVNCFWTAATESVGALGRLGRARLGADAGSSFSARSLSPAWRRHRPSGPA